MFKWIKRRRIARYWQKVGMAVYELGKNHPKSWTCKYRVPYMVKKMQADGLVCNKDFAIERGHATRDNGSIGQHIKLTVYGIDVDPSSPDGIKVRGFTTNGTYQMVRWSWGRYRKGA